MDLEKEGRGSDGLFSGFTKKELETALRELLEYARLLRASELNEEQRNALLEYERQLRALGVSWLPPPPPQPDEGTNHTRSDHANVTLDADGNAGSVDAGDTTGDDANSEPDEEIEGMERRRRAPFHSRDELFERARGS